MKMHFKEIKYLNSFSQLKQDHVFLYYIYTITRFSKIIYNGLTVYFLIYLDFLMVLNSIEKPLYYLFIRYIHSFQIDL